MAYDDNLDPGPTREELLEHEARAHRATQIPCGYCGAKADQPCQNKATGQPVKKFVAHASRITASDKGAPAVQLVVIDDYDDEVPF